MKVTPSPKILKYTNIEMQFYQHYSAISGFSDQVNCYKCQMQHWPSNVSRPTLWGHPSVFSVRQLVTDVLLLFQWETGDWATLRRRRMMPSTLAQLHPPFPKL